MKHNSQKIGKDRGHVVTRLIIASLCKEISLRLNRKGIVECCSLLKITFLSNILLKSQFFLSFNVCFAFVPNNIAISVECNINCSVRLYFLPLY